MRPRATDGGTDSRTDVEQVNREADRFNAEEEQKEGFSKHEELR